MGATLIEECKSFPNESSLHVKPRPSGQGQSRWEVSFLLQ